MNNNMFYRGPSSFRGPMGRPPMGPGPGRPPGPPPFRPNNNTGGFIVPFVLGGLTYSIFNNRPYPNPYLYPPYYRPYPYYY